MTPDSPAAASSLSPFRPWRVLRPNEWVLILAILIVAGGTAALDRSHSYVNFPVRSLKDNARRVAPLGILAVAATVVIISGGIDLSLGSMAALSGTICATLLMALGGNRFDTDEGVGALIWSVAIGASLLAGLIVGTLHTWMITSLRLPPFIVTLGSLVGLRSLGRALCWYMTGQFRGSNSEDLPFSDPFCDFLTARVELAMLLMLVIALLTWLVLGRTILGRHLYAMGGNEQASRLSGIRTENVKWFAYCFSAVAASITGIFFISEAGAKPTTLANGYELTAIASAVVGGCSLQGGVGTIPGAILGAMFLRAVVDSVSRIVKANADMYEGLIVGIVVVVAVTFSQLRDIRQSGRQLFPGPLGFAAIPSLALASGLVCLIAMGTGAGTAGLVVPLLALVAWKVLESRRQRSGG